MKAGRKILAVLLAVVMVLSLAACTPGGEIETAPPESTEPSAESSTASTEPSEEPQSASWEYKDGVLTISGEGTVGNYKDDIAPWEEHKAEITTLIIGDGITSIGASAFAGLENLRDVEGGENVIKVGTDAFSGTAWKNAQTDDFKILNGWLLEYRGDDIEVVIPDGVKVIGNGVFRKRFTFSSVIMPDGMISIGDYAFEDCNALRTVTIPETVTNIGVNAFRLCTQIESVTIPSSVTSIGAGAFFWCESLNEVLGGDNVSKIGQSAFAETPWRDAQTDTFVMLGSCLIDYNGSSIDITIPNSTTSIGTSFPDNVRSIKIPASVTSIDSHLTGIESLSVIAVDGENPAYCVVDGVLFNKEKTELICYPSGKPGSSYEIPDSVTSIGEYAFAGCSSLTSITIPDSVSTIGDNAFEECEVLTTAEIPDGITSIGLYMFADCISLSSVTIPDSVTNIAGYAFDNCVSLTDVHYGGSLEDWEEIIISSHNDALFSCTIH